MEVISKIILAIVQGITEIVPVSSSGHILLIAELTGTEIDLTFLTLLHLATGLAIIGGFWDEIKYIFSSKKRNYLIKILSLAILPGILAGVLGYNYVEDFLHNPYIVIFSLIFFGILMILVDYLFDPKTSIKNIEKIKPKNAILIGLAQIIALIPGTSRSGITIMPAVIMGIDKKVAFAFSFLIGVPLIIGSFFFEIAKNEMARETIFQEENIIGGIASFVFAYLTILIFKKLLHTKFLAIFGIYRIAVGILAAILIAI